MIDVTISFKHNGQIEDADVTLLREALSARFKDRSVALAGKGVGAAADEASLTFQVEENLLPGIQRSLTSALGNLERASKFASISEVRCSGVVLS